MRVAAVVLGAGRGERLGHPVPKAFVPLAGEPLLRHGVRAMTLAASVDCVVPVVPAGALTSLSDVLGELQQHPKLRAGVVGGEQRQDSVSAGLAALPDSIEWVAVHDAARALVRPAAVERVVAVARETGAALLAIPAADTIKRVAEGVVRETPPRSECWAAQTPQVFRRDWLAQGLEKAAAAGFQATDCAELVEQLGIAVSIVEGDTDNLKVTHPADLVVAEHLLAGREA